MSIRHPGLVMLCAWGVFALWACEEPGPEEAPNGASAVARFEPGPVTEEEVQRQLQRLPPNLRRRFESQAGRLELTRSIRDKQLLAFEAARRGFTRDPELRRQVRELEEQLAIKALLAAEERAAPPITEAEARAFYEANKERFTEPERLRVARVLAAVPTGSSRAKWSQARQRAEGWRRRLLAGEPVAKVAQGGDGPERARGGELGLLARGEFSSPAIESAAAALSKVGAASPVVEEPEGASALVLLERQPPRVRPFEEVRQEVLGRMAPMAQRKVFDGVLARLRAELGTSLEQGSGAAASSDAVGQHLQTQSSRGTR
ncbi:MAG: peptidyl-prolyl cis-trans isomerase [Myxococcaceae bacterium]|nr:peptidyl-prolyl cis-trans isomerase [Myxococcaceae bacterium]